MAFFVQCLLLYYIYLVLYILSFILPTLFFDQNAYGEILDCQVEDKRVALLPVP